jgi:delta 1-pyrroline-5-carboxylate dehydrogenase
MICLWRALTSHLGHVEVSLRRTAAGANSSGHVYSLNKVCCVLQIVSIRRWVMLDKTKFYIDGRWVAPIDGTDFPVINPATEDAFATISLGGQKDAEAAIAAAKAAFPAWSVTSPANPHRLSGKIAGGL